MKLLFVLSICVAIQQQALAQTTPAPIVRSTPNPVIIKPRIPIKCGSFTNRISDFTTNYDAIAKACSSLGYREIPAVRQLREHNTNVQQTMNSDNSRRYALYNFRLYSNTSISEADRRQRQTDEKKIVDDAIANYKTTSDQYLAVINDLASRLDTTAAMQRCQEIAQTGFVAQMTNANTLIALPPKICDSLNSDYGRFQQVLDTSYQKIGAQIPR